MVGLSPKTSPVEPSSEIQSPSRSTSFLSLRDGQLFPTLVTSISPAPPRRYSHSARNHGGGTVMPPREVRMPFALPCREVIRYGFRAHQDYALRACTTASSAVKTTRPQRRRVTPADRASNLADFLPQIEHRMQKLIELLVDHAHTPSCLLISFC